jgi:hypothetical protein
MWVIKRCSNTFRYIMKFIIYFFFFKIVIYSIFFLKLKKKNVLYTNHFGFGDFLFFCVHIRKRINSNNKIFCFSKLQYEIANFFFEQKYIAKSFILAPRFISDSHLGYNFLDKQKIFIPTNPKRFAPDNRKVPISDFYKGTRSSIKFIKLKINARKISTRIVDVLKKPTISLFIKNFSKYKNNHINFQVRQTRDLIKIQRIIYFLNQKNFNVIILGTEKDHFIQLFSKKIYKNKQILKNIFLFKDLSDNYSISDQAYVALNSIGYIGSASGAMGFFGLLNKKTILIDAVFYYADKYWKDFIFLYKKIYNKKNKTLKKFIWKKYYDPSSYKIVEVNFKDIKNVLVKKILNNY